MRFAPPLEIRATATGEIAGYGCTYQRDSYGSRALPGAFAKSLAGHRAAGTTPPMLWAHDHARPVGTWSEIAEDSQGLFVRGSLLINTAAGREAYELVKAGASTGLSIGFDVPRGGVELADDETLFKQIDLKEISLVTLPANPGARITHVRSLAGPRDLEEALRDAGLSKRQARGVVAMGWRGLAGDDAEPAELERLLTRINRRAADMAARLQK